MQNTYDATSYFKDFFQNMLSFSKAFDFKDYMSKLDFNKVMEINKKNSQCASEINDIINNKAQCIMMKQSEMFQNNVKNLMEAFQNFPSNTNDPNDIIAKQNQLYQISMKQNMEYAKEIANLFTQANMEVFQKYIEQMQENMSEYSENAMRQAQKVEKASQQQQKKDNFS